jgi:glutathione S-transferase
MFIAEKGLDIPFEQVDLKTQEQLSESYLAKVPTGTVPALETDDGQIITENLAIAAYLEKLHPEPPLMGRTPEETARIMEWEMRITFGAFMACAEMLRNSSPHMKGRALPGRQNLAQIPELAERGRTRITGFWDDMDAHLGQHAFMSGNTYSYADITGTVCVDFSKWVKASPLETHENIARWHDTMKTRPNYGA